MGAEHTATVGSWHVDGHNLAAVIRCVRERGHPEARHLTGDWETVARCEGPDWAANARLIAAAPDHSLVLRMMAAGVLRWKPDTKELCHAGLCHSTKLDAFGCPVLTPSLRAALSTPTPKGDPT